MSKFFANNSDSESSSSESESENEGQQFPTSNFMLSDDEEDVKRVVRSAKEKRYEQLYTIIKNIRNSKKIRDFYKMESSFVELCKAYDKARPVVAKEENGVVPKFYVRILVEMEDLINETWEDRDGRKNMSKNNSKSLSALRQKLRKYIRNEFDEEVEKFRQNPDEEDEDLEQVVESEGSDDENDFRKSPVDVASDFKKKEAIDDDEDSDDSYWDEDSMSSSDDSEPTNFRKQFMKSQTDSKTISKKKKTRSQRQVKADSLEDGDWTTVDRGAVEKPKMFEKDAEISHALVIKKLHEIMAARGKKRTNRKEQIELLTELYDISEKHTLGIGVAGKIKFAIVSAIFDYNPKISEAMKPEYWKKCVPAVKELLQMIIDNEETLVTGEHVSDDQEVYEEAPYKVIAIKLLT